MKANNRIYRWYISFKTLCLFGFMLFGASNIYAEEAFAPYSEQPLPIKVLIEEATLNSLRTLPYAMQDLVTILEHFGPDQFPEDFQDQTYGQMASANSPLGLVLRRFDFASPNYYMGSPSWAIKYYNIQQIKDAAAKISILVENLNALQNLRADLMSSPDDTQLRTEIAEAEVIVSTYISDAPWNEFAEFDDVEGFSWQFGINIFDERVGSDCRIDAILQSHTSDSVIFENAGAYDIKTTTFQGQDYFGITTMRCD